MDPNGMDASLEQSMRHLAELQLGLYATLQRQVEMHQQVMDSVTAQVEAAARAIDLIVAPAAAAAAILPAATTAADTAVRTVAEAISFTQWAQEAQRSIDFMLSAYTAAGVPFGDTTDGFARWYIRRKQGGES